MVSDGLRGCMCLLVAAEALKALRCEERGGEERTQRVSSECSLS